ncbi:MAG: Flp pilus assembly complex ATPase component TadA [Nitrospirae bacterium]|nr:Flp pilus assembly complex ATPase component TadA [Nitrospirota bacterium]
MITSHRTRSKKLGELLVENGLLSEEQCKNALDVQKKTGKRLGQAVIDLGYVKEEDLLQVLSRQMSIPHIWLRKGLVDPRIVNVIPGDKARLYKIMPMFRIKDTLIVATSDPQAIFVFDEIEKTTGLAVQPVLTRSGDIEKAIAEHYKDSIEIGDFGAASGDGSRQPDIQRGRDFQKIEEPEEGSPIINVVNNIILRAIRDKASDIHIEPDKSKLRIRYRVDGMLYEVMTHTMDAYPAIISRLKVMANLDIAERRLPQDGRIQVMVEGRSVDLRFSSMPGILGEKIVLRILDKKNVILDLNQLGFSGDTLSNFKRLLKRPYGLILVTGPTGSGKTTTLYAAMSFLNSIEKNIVTIEDPVEYQMEIINQNQVRDAIGLTFSVILRHTLRQDPDIIMVGEIRDRETAEIAIQSSLTGHLVLSTLHTNDSPSAITRLLDMGIEPYMISSALTGVIAQRLIRTICPECKTLIYPPSAVLERYNLEAEKDMQIAKGKGCPACYGSGYKGRAGLYELLEVNESLQTMILSNPSLEEIRKRLREWNHSNMETEGLNKVRDRITTFEEVTRAVSTGI